MNYCVPFYTDFKYKKFIEELILKYKVNKGEQLVNYVEENFKQKQRIIIDITDVIEDLDNAIPALQMLYKKHPNMTIRTSVTCYEELREAELPYFFLEYCHTLEQVYSFIKKGVTDIYVVSDLCFNMVKVSEYCHKKNVKVRIFPNIAQYDAGCKGEIPEICQFFVRPEDIQYYEPYVDVCEFIAEEYQLSVLFEIYKEERWLGTLPQLITGLKNLNFINETLFQYEFAKTRLKCQHKCMLENCTICPLMVTLAENFEEEEVMFYRDAKTKWKEEEKTE